VRHRFTVQGKEKVPLYCKEGALCVFGGFFCSVFFFAAASGAALAGLERPVWLSLRASFFELCAFREDQFKKIKVHTYCIDNG
jgi:hypothetical protein